VLPILRLLEAEGRDSDRMRISTGSRQGFRCKYLRLLLRGEECVEANKSRSVVFNSEV
jgi:hypothetical protein